MKREDCTTQQQYTRNVRKKNKDIKPLTTQTLSEPEVRLSGPEV